MGFFSFSEPLHTYKWVIHSHFTYETLASLELNGAAYNKWRGTRYAFDFFSVLLFHSLLRNVFSGNEALVRRHNISIHTRLEFGENGKAKQIDGIYLVVMRFPSAFHLISFVEIALLRLLHLFIHDKWLLFMQCMYVQIAIAIVIRTETQTQKHKRLDSMSTRFKSISKLRTANPFAHNTFFLFSRFA